MVTGMTGDQKLHPAVGRGGITNLVIQLEPMRGGDLRLFNGFIFCYLMAHASQEVNDLLANILK